MIGAIVKSNDRPAECVRVYQVCRRRDCLRDRASIALEGGGSAAMGEMLLLRRSQRGGGQGQGSEASTIARSPTRSLTIRIAAPSVVAFALPLRMLASLHTCRWSGPPRAVVLPTSF